MEEQLTRLNKYLSEVGYCSRREADKLIDAGRVTINGEVPEMGTKVKKTDVVQVDGETITNRKEDFVYLAFHKPVGIVCTTDTGVEKDNIIDFINYPERIFPIGRLDKPSEGLIFMTNDGDIVNKILRASNNHEKEYVVTVDKPISQTFLERMSKGIYLEDLDKTTKPCIVKKINSTTFKIILTQGLNRQIRRMCDYLNYEVLTLKRIRIMNIELDVPVGAYREFTKDELKTLNELLEASTKTHESKLVEREGRTLTKKQIKPKTEEPKESRSTRRINRRRD
ncbi:23S rRNA pseudouridine(2604) synthase RluF [Aurantibacter aestuarii]|uniref:Pseudouridine synthase n=1 Tax=Aurantibacter aestuarii TaxID=1266046 RepID=A0A2T1NG40_9FLAO|nr:23S rRNA pseudouridine(2604) synthase RluF [Aurantibacter aestuarii]PSG91744.1 23S rRNA pseudouridine(2604) synthase RluF [Aurantibacter aestuarii]